MCALAAAVTEPAAAGAASFAGLAPPDVRDAEAPMEKLDQKRQQRPVDADGDDACKRRRVQVSSAIKDRLFNDGIAGGHASPVTQMEIVVKSDYDCFFEGLVKAVIDGKMAKGEPLQHGKVIISAGPWRMQDIAWESKGSCLEVDFYSVGRTRCTEKLRKALTAVL